MLVCPLSIAGWAVGHFPLFPDAQSKGKKSQQNLRRLLLYFSSPPHLCLLGENFWLDLMQFSTFSFFSQTDQPSPGTEVLTYGDGSMARAGPKLCSGSGSFLQPAWGYLSYLRPRRSLPCGSLATWCKPSVNTCLHSSTCQSPGQLLYGLLPSIFSLTQTCSLKPLFSLKSSALFSTTCLGLGKRHP